MSFSNDAVPIGQGRFQSIGIKKKTGFSAVVDSEGVNKQGGVWEAGSSV